MLVFKGEKVEYSARILARDSDGNIYMTLGFVEIGPWASEIRWVENPMHQMWFYSQDNRDAAVAQVNPDYSKYDIVEGSVELLTRSITTEVVVAPK